MPRLSSLSIKSFGSISLPAPVNTVVPAISGTAQARQVLSLSTGTWTGVGITYSYQWQYGTTNISGATSSTYTISSTYVGSTIRCVVTASNFGNTVSVNTVATSSVTAAVPDAPTIGVAASTGSTTATVSFTAPDNGGSTITSYTATSSPGNITRTLNQAGSGTITITGLTAATNYTFTVKATNGIGLSAASNASNQITTGVSAPVNTVAPTVTGTAQARQTLSCSTGTWTGSATITYAYQWQYGATNISGATSSTYVIDQAYIGSTIRCVVTATNGGGSVSANSNATSAVTANVPLAPTIGTATQTSYSTANITFTAPTANGGATITSYTATSSPGGLTGTLSQAGSGTISVNGLSPLTNYTFTVTATNSAGTSSASTSSNQITTPAQPPANTVAPAVTGTAQARQTLSCSTGTWTGSATITYAYQWQYGTTNISGATSSTYVIDQVYVGSTIRCVVTATNGGGSVSANSNATSAVTANVPLAPTIGTATATAYNSATVTFTAPSTNGGATITTYTATSSPGGLTGTLSQEGSGTITVNGLSPLTNYTFTVTASNSAGTSSSSISSNQITTPAQPPVNTVAPAITGTATSGSTLTASPGTWTGSATITYAYQWYRSTGTYLGAGSTYVLTGADVGYTVRVLCTASNSIASGTAYSSYTTTIAGISLPGNLLAYFDATKTSSYPGSGSTWYNLSNSSQNATLNTPSFVQQSGVSCLALDSSSTINLALNYASGRSEFTVGMWLYTTSTATNMEVYTEGNGLYWQYTISSSSWYTRDSSTGFSGARDNDISSGIVTNQWFYVVYTYSVSSSAKIVYRNGSQVVSSTTSINALTTDRDLAYARIGAAVDGVNFTGRIAEVHIYDVALTASEVLNNFNVTRNKYGI